jgi:hypothetical protein
MFAGVCVVIKDILYKKKIILPPPQDLEHSEKPVIFQANFRFFPFGFGFGASSPEYP